MRKKFVKKTKFVEVKDDTYIDEDKELDNVTVIPLKKSEVEALNEPKVLTGDEKTYFDMLVSMIAYTKEPSYTHLLHRLWFKEFYSIVDYDENREEYALDLRKTLSFERDQFGKARVLEILIVLAANFSDATRGFKNYMGFRKTFWKFIDNLDLTEYDDASIVEDPKVYTFDSDIDDILNTFLDRTYDKDGRNGGLFPINDPPKDLRKVELWYQLQWYISENNTK